MIRSHMALSTGLRLSCFSNREQMTCMACRTASHAAIRINSTYAVVWPYCEILGGFSCHIGTMARLAAAGCCSMGYLLTIYRDVATLNLTLHIWKFFIVE